MHSRCRRWNTSATPTREPETYEYLDRIKAWESNWISQCWSRIWPLAGCLWWIPALAQDALVYQADEDYSPGTVCRVRRGDQLHRHPSGRKSWGVHLHQPNIKPVFPFRERGLVKADIIHAGRSELDYQITTAGAAALVVSSAFFQRKYSGVQEHPKLFEEAVKYEQNIVWWETLHLDSRWNIAGTTCS